MLPIAIPIRMPTTNNDRVNIDQECQRVKEAGKICLGYPVNCGYDYSEVTKLCSHNIINVGDPRVDTTLKFATKDSEKKVLEFFAGLWGTDFNKVWGYTTQAGTEGNLQGLYVGRESAKNRPHVFFTSITNSHYSIYKIARLLCLNISPIKAQPNGEMDYQDLELKIQENKDKFILINLNWGTTMKGAHDNSEIVHSILSKYNKQKDCYIHVDGALSGFFLSFLKKEMFFKHFNSISISGHKFLGVPFPCGIFMMEKNLVEQVSVEIEYIGATDCMISGSRNGHAAVFMRYMIEKKGYDGFMKDIQQCLDNADYLTKKIPGSWRNENSITVIIKKPNKALVSKWQLACQEEIAHVVVMPHVSKDLLDTFVVEYLAQ